MLLKIHNKPSTLEPIVLSLLSAGTLIGALWFFLDISKIPPLSSPLFWGASLLIVGVIIAVIKKRLRRDGILEINTTDETFRINGNDSAPYADLRFYSSKLIVPPFIKFQSRMVITIGADETSTFSIMDDRASVNRTVGNSKAELDALEALIEGSSLSEEQKASFSNWLGRARLIEK